MPEFGYIAVEGIDSSGKTELAKFLAERYDASLILDETHHNPFLKDFYVNPAQSAFSAQIFFLLSRYQQLKELNQPDLFERRKVADFIFARDGLLARLNLNQREYGLYQSLSKLMEAEIPIPDLVIYLQTSAAVAWEKIKKRKNSLPTNLTLNYLENLSQAFDRYFFHYRQSPLLIVNANSLDLFDNKSDLELIWAEIPKTTFGTRYFAPVSKDVLL